MEKLSGDEDGGGTLPLLRRGQALILTVLLVGLAACLLGLLLQKRERRLTDASYFGVLQLFVLLLFLLLQKKILVSFAGRELVIQKVTSCCRRANQVSYKYSKVGRSLTPIRFWSNVTELQQQQQQKKKPLTWK